MDMVQRFAWLTVGAVVWGRCLAMGDAEVSDGSEDKDTEENPFELSLQAAGKDSSLVPVFVIAGLLTIVCLFIAYIKCIASKKQGRRKDPSDARSLGVTNYNLKAFDPSDPVNLKERMLYDMSTGSPDIPGWDKEKDIVSAEKNIGCI